MPSPSESIYLDHAATTPVRPEVVRAMARCMGDDFGNPSSAHGWGRAARRRLEEARARVAAALRVEPSGVHFTRGGTEADNLAVLGRTRLDGEGALVVTSAVEHPAVMAAANQAALEGARHVSVDFRAGIFDLDELRDVLAHGASVVSCMWVNNETGLVLPVAEIARICRLAGAPFHSDAVQAVGKVPFGEARPPADLLTVTGHKIGGPKGTGALVVRGGTALAPLHFGGGQERGLRPGTEDVAGAIGLAAALEAAVAEAGEESARLSALRDSAAAGILDAVPSVRVNGDGLPRAPHILSLAVPDADSDTMVAALDADGIAVSGGSACASGSGARSPSLEALSPGDGAAALRLSFGALNHEAQIERIVAGVAGAVERARALEAW